jgi:predicted DsbA family dithiol-disulfide isomerase
MLPTVEIYASIDCPYAYLVTSRLRQLWPEFAGKVQVVWRALSLEYVNKQGTQKPTIDAERELFQQIDPSLPFRQWSRPDWQWPVTMWPAFEALACAQAQSPDAAFAMSWALRQGLFAESRSLALRHELLEIAQEVASKTDLDLKRFEDDWDSGRYKSHVIAESKRGWHELKVDGSATLILPGGRCVINPAIGEIDFDEAHNILRSYRPYTGNALDTYVTC